MNTQGFVAGPLSVLCIIALVMGTASAAVITAADTDRTPVHQHPSPESIINSLEQQGVDVTEVKTAIQNGDTKAVKTWLGNYFQSHRPVRSTTDLTNSTRQQEIITRLEEEGVDVTEVKTDLQNGDTEAVKAWLEAHRPSRQDGSGHAPFDLSDASRQQEIISKLEKQGVDVTQVKTDLRNGDNAAVVAWLETYFRNNRPSRTPPGLSDPAREQRIIERLEKQGVDVAEVKTELQSGDTSAVQTWLETYLHSHEGEMAFHHFPRETPAASRTGTGE